MKGIAFLLVMACSSASTSYDEDGSDGTGRRGKVILDAGATVDTPVVFIFDTRPVVKAEVGSDFHCSDCPGFCSYPASGVCPAGYDVHYRTLCYENRCTTQIASEHVCCPHSGPTDPRQGSCVYEMAGCK